MFSLFKFGINSSSSDAFSKVEIFISFSLESFKIQLLLLLLFVELLLLLFSFKLFEILDEFSFFALLEAGLILIMTSLLAFFNSSFFEIKFSVCVIILILTGVEFLTGGEVFILLGLV